jgi:hypothetical protein
MRRSVGSPYINRFLQPDSIIPDQTNPQSWNRFAYVLNNPIRFNDPTGHVCSDPDDHWSSSCEGSPLQATRVGDRMIRGNGKTVGGCGGRGQLKCGRVGNENRPPVISVPDNPCLLITGCSQTPGEFAQELAPFTSEEACAYLLDDRICDSSTWQFISDPSYLQSVQITLQNSCLANFWSCYNPDAFIAGASISGSAPGFYNVAGIEEIVMFSDLTHQSYIYAGQGVSAGVGGSASAYGGIVFNIKNTGTYKGPFGTAGITVSIADKGITAFYFWDSTKQPLAPGVTQGLAVGYAPGAQASIWGSSTVYTGFP